MRRWLNYLVGSTLLLFSEGIYDLAFALYAYQISGKASVGAITYALGYLSEILISLFGGGFLDRTSKVKVYTWTLSLKILIFLGLVVFAQNKPLDEKAIWFFAFVIDALHHYSKLNNFVVIRDLFPEDQLARAHGWLAAIQGSSRIASPVLGAALIGYFGAIHALLFCAVFQACALVAYRLAFHDFKPPVHRTAESAWFSTLVALREAWGSARWRRFLILDALCVLMSACSTLLMVPLIKHLFAPTDAQTGTFFAVGAAGSIAGGLLLARTSNWSFKRFVSRALFAQALFLLGVVYAPSFAFAVACKFFLDFATTAYFRSGVIYLQTEAPEARRASYYTASDALGRALGLVGVLTAGAVFDAVRASTLYAGLALGLLALAATWAASTNRTAM